MSGCRMHDRYPVSCIVHTADISLKQKYLKFSPDYEVGD